MTATTYPTNTSNPCLCGDGFDCFAPREGAASECPRADVNGERFDLDATPCMNHIIAERGCRACQRRNRS